MRRLILISSLILFFRYTYSQSVNIDSIRINGRLARMTSLQHIMKSGIVIDSLLKVPESGYVFSADSLVYIGESYFEYDSENKICMAEVIVFDDKIDHIFLGKYIVNKWTTFEDLRKMFPLDCSEIKPIHIFGEKKTFGCCGVPVSDSKGRLQDMRINFFLQNDLLLRVDFWEPN